MASGLVPVRLATVDQLLSEALDVVDPAATGFFTADQYGFQFGPPEPGVAYGWIGMRRLPRW